MLISHFWLLPGLIPYNNNFTDTPSKNKFDKKSFRCVAVFLFNSFPGKFRKMNNIGQFKMLIENWDGVLI